MGNEQFKALMKSFNSLNRYVRLLSISRSPFRNEARSFQKKMNARYEAFKKGVMEDRKIAKVEACFDCVESKILKVIDKVESYL